MEEFLIKTGLSGILWAAIYWGVQVFGHWIAWWAALLISVVFVFGGFLLLTGDDWFD